MKRIVMFMLVLSAASAVAKFSPIGPHWPHAQVDDGTGESDDEGADDDSGD